MLSVRRFIKEMQIDFWTGRQKRFSGFLINLSDSITLCHLPVTPSLKQPNPKRSCTKSNTGFLGGHGILSYKQK